MNFNKQSEHPQKSESALLIERLSLKAGKNITLVKKEMLSDSALQRGHVLRGKIVSDVAIGLPILFENGSTTSNIQKIEEKDGTYLVNTATSVYELAIQEAEDITDFESFETSKGSVYTVLENGQVQRVKHALDDPSYRGEDVGQKKEKQPSDIILFYDPKKDATYLNDLGAIDPKTEKTVAQSIAVGVYKKIDEDTYNLVKNSADLEKPFIFLRVNKNDSFTLKESFSFKELKDFQDRTFKPECKGVGILITSEGGNITNIPTIGFNTIDYRYGADGEVESIHGGHTIVSIKER